MEIKIACLLVVCCSYAQNVTFKEDKAKVKARVAGGTREKINVAPWHVGIREFREPGIINANVCGGSWIAQDWVLTAAHCIYKLDFSKLVLNHQQPFCNPSNFGNLIFSSKFRPIIWEEGPFNLLTPIHIFFKK